MNTLITADQLKYICPRTEHPGVIAPLLSTICPQYGISTPDIFHEFIARVTHECNEFNTFVENLNYKTTALIQLFPKRITRSQAEMYGRNWAHPANQQMIANIIYGGEWGRVNLGNTQQGDGWIFRGSGPVQITGRGNVTKFTTYYNTRFGTTFTPEAMAEMLRTNIEIGIHSACWIFAVAKNLIQLAIDDKLEVIVKRINGGLLGLAETKQYYERAKKIIV